MGNSELYYGLNGRPDVAAHISHLTHLPGLKVLEIGCGVGTFRKHFPSACEYWGVEPHQESAFVASKHLFRVFPTNLEDSFENIPNEYFDLIIMNDVLEHIASTDFILDVFRQKLVPQGSIVVSIPNVRYVDLLYRLIFLNDWEYIDSGILDKTHLRFFTSRSFLRICERHSLRILLARGINPIRLNLTTLRAFCYSFVMMILSIVFGRSSRFRQYLFLLSLS